MMAKTDRVDTQLQDFSGAVFNSNEYFASKSIRTNPDYENNNSKK